MVNKACVMIVEADILVRHPLAEYLRECGYKVIETFNADEARQLLGGDLPSVEIDIVLADANGAGKAGFAFAAWTRENHPGVEVLLAGSIAGAAEKAGDICKEGPALTKPYDHKQVLEHIHRLVAARDRHRRGQNSPSS
jgi:DNA-binding response OmpR family regulator